ncbi:hypothetical protein ACFX13_028289 [Malus domestica]
MEDGIMRREKEEREEVKLGLGIGVGCNYGDQNGKKKKMKCGGGGGGVGGGCGGGFTAVQLHELEEQALIYKHLAAGVPVPVQLLVPIWNSVAASFGSSNAAAIYQHFPTFIGFNSVGGFDYRSKMDPEPGRCRRTDGKKWRCSKSVVPGQKYCQQHMHRGCQRSRKHVETSETSSPSSAKQPKNTDAELCSSKTNLRISTPNGLHLKAQSSDNIGVSQGTTNASSGYQECKTNIRSVTTTSVAMIPANRTATSPASAVTIAHAGPTAATNSSSNKNSISIGVKDYSSNHAGDNCMIRGSSLNRNSTIVGSTISPGLGFSPKSVLQGRQMTFLISNGVCFNNSSGTELEPRRCRRTDGKKWRCRRDVLPDQKYCGLHVHRGAKRQTKDSQPIGVPSSSVASMNTAQISQTTSTTKKTDRAIPNTNLSMSIPARPPPMQNDEKSNSSGDSDTTITDTSLAAYEGSYVSS